jgi:P27 family predicted phage terminase small subunit
MGVEGLGEAGRRCWEACQSADWVDARLDQAAVLHLCRLEDEAAGLCVVLERDGLTQGRPIIAPKGEVVGEEFVSHPALAELRKLDRSLGELRARLGLDPESRARLHLTIVDGPDFVDVLKAELQARRAGVPNPGWVEAARERLEMGKRPSTQTGSAEGRRRR